MNELQIVQKRLKGLLLKRPGFVFALCGPAGIGKTFTVKTLLRETPCRNLSLHAQTSSSKLLQALPRPKKTPIWLERIFKQLEAEEFIEPKMILDAVSTSLVAAAPFVLHLEDVHELSDDQLGFILELTTMIGRLKGVGVLLTSRTALTSTALKNNAITEALKKTCQPLQLEALSKTDATVMLEREVGAVLPTEATAWIHARAAGNPLFTLEFLRFLTQRGFLWSDGQHWHWREPPTEAMPLTVEILIEQRLVSVLNVPKFAKLLKAGSLIPNSLMQDASLLWAAMAEITPEHWRRTVAELETWEVLRNGLFTHPLLPEIIRRGISAAQRQQLAQNAIAYLEAEHPQEAVLFLESAELESNAALALLQRAWTQADALGNELGAAKLVAQAAKLAPQEQGVQLAINAAKRLIDLDAHTALELLDWVLKLEPNNVQAMLLRARTMVDTVEFAQAEEVFEQLPKNVKTSQVGQETWFEMICRANKYHAHHKRLVLYWDEHPEARTHFELISARISAHIDQIEPEEAIALAQSSLADPNLTDDWLRAKLLNSLGNVHRSVNQFEQADETFSQVIELLEQKLDGRRVFVVLHNRAMTRHAIGRIQEAKLDIEDCIAKASTVRATSTLSPALAFLADIEMDAGHYERAEDLLRQARELQEPLGLNRFQVEIEISSSELYRIWPGQAYTGMLALKHGRNALRLARQLESPAAVLTALIVAGKVEAQFGEIQTAQAIAHELDGMDNTDTNLPYHEASWVRALIFERQNELGQALMQYRLARQNCVEARHKGVEYILDFEVARLSKDTTLARAALEWFEKHEMRHYSNRVKLYFPHLTPHSNQPEHSTNTNAPNIRLKVLGPMRIVRDQHAQIVRGRKRQELLAYLLERRMTGYPQVNKLDLIDALYPDTDETRASANLKETVHAIRVQFGSDLIQTQSSSYSLGEIGSDAEFFLRSGNTNLWRGAYLEAEIVSSSDSAARENLHLALLTQAQTILETNPDEALRVGKILLAFDVFNLDHLELCVRALQLRNNHKSLNRLYENARNQLLEVAEEIPKNWQDFLSARKPTFLTQT